MAYSRQLNIELCLFCICINIQVTQTAYVLFDHEKFYVSRILITENQEKMILFLHVFT